MEVRRHGTAEDAVIVAGIHARARSAYYAAAGVEQPDGEVVVEPERVAMWRALMADPHNTVCSTAVAGRMRGFCAWAPTVKARGGAVELLALYVEPSTWGQGVGGLLHGLFIDSLKANAEIGVLEVWESNVNALSFYLRRGWQRTAISRPGPLDTPFVTLQIDIALPGQKSPPLP